ncbi:MAG TPA: lantibiotic dehydratase, partial [Pyrinomonadaceae bacterium]|nr:lantibiotic dehydratase [Pyrinomonadaceae bacterium]
MVSYPVRKASATGDRAVIELPDHLVRLSADGWMVWRCVGLRGAGFPAEEVLKLVSVEAAAAADQLLDAEEETRRVRAHVLSVLSEALDELKTDPERWQDQHRDLVAAAQQVRKRRRPVRANLPPDVLTLCDSLEEATARTERMKVQFHSAFKESSARLSTVIQEISRNKYFREAVTWQNHKAVQGSIDALLNMQGAEAGRGAERRKREMLVASYLQRYCLKNDTIGFFGPVGWAKFTEDGPAVAAKSGPRLLASRQVYFECWCIDALADVLEQNPALRPWIIPQRMPYLRLDGVTARLPLSPPFKLAAKEAAVLWACEGERPAYDIATDLLAGGHYDFQDHHAIYAVLEQLRQRKLISWTLEVPVGLYPERALWRSLEQIRDERLRKESEAPLLELEQAREEIRLAADDAEELHKALANLESTFTRLTNTPATRAAGQMYAARTLVYEDCRRDLAVEIGPDLLAALGPPLSVLLQGARWLTFEAAERFRTAFRSLFERIAEKTGSSTIEAIDFWYAAHPLFFDPAESPIATLLD